MPLAPAEFQFPGIRIRPKLGDVETDLGQPVERDPLRQRLVAQHAAGARGPVHRDHERSQSQRNHDQRHQHFDEREAARLANAVQLRFSTLFELSRETLPIASPSTTALA